MVAGTPCSTPSAIFFMVPRRILPERVLGRRFTTATVLNAATGPIRSRTISTSSRQRAEYARATPDLVHTRPTDTTHLIEPAEPHTAQHATSVGADSTTS